MKIKRRVPGLTPARAEVLELVRAQPDPVSLDALCDVLAKHPNTVREQVNWLHDRGLVRRVRAFGPGRGRPSWRYVGVERRGEGSEFAETAASYAWAVGTYDGADIDGARRDGVELGRNLTRDRDATPCESPRQARAEVVGMLDDLGYEPVPDARAERVVLRRCPLLQAAKTHTTVVCALHVGVVEASLAAYGADADDVTLYPFTAPGECLLMLTGASDDAARQA